MDNQTEALATPHHHTSLGVDNRKLLWWVFIASECMFFGSLMMTYLLYKGKSMTGPYPHDIIDPATGELAAGLLDIPLTSLSTFVLLMSSLAMVIALSAVQRGTKKGAFWLAMTAFLGAIFLGFQAYEFTHFYQSGLTLTKNLFGSSFFVLTGFHGAHVTVGVLWLSTLAILTARGKVPPAKSLNVEIAGLYWHFVDVVWIIIFTLVYLIP